MEAVTRSNRKPGPIILTNLFSDSEQQRRDRFQITLLLLLLFGSLRLNVALKVSEVWNF